MPRANNNYDIATRSQALTLKLEGKSTVEIYKITGMSRTAQFELLKKAKSRGLNTEALLMPKIVEEYVTDGDRSGRPSKHNDEIVEAVVQQVRTDRYGREKTCKMIALSLMHLYTLSAMTIWRVLKAAGFSKTKPTRKPGLTARMKADRLAFCLKYAHWTLEDWRNIIWSDETSVVLQHRRGGYKIWRRSEEALLRSCIRERWKGFQEFMFWGCFSWHAKGPYHIWKPETAQQTKLATEDLNTLNTALEPIAKAQWEITNGVRRLGLRNLPGKKPKWKFNEDTGKLVRGKGKGIDWYRYQKEVLNPKLIPFAQQQKALRPGTIVQEDKAAPHIHTQQATVFSRAEVERLLWPGNSPDLNMIEPAWWYLKRWTSKKGALKSRAEAEQAWKKAWEDLDMKDIKAWCDRVYTHVQEVIRLKGGNEYHEGRGLNADRVIKRRGGNPRIRAIADRVMQNNEPPLVENANPNALGMQELLGVLGYGRNRG